MAPEANESFDVTEITFLIGCLGGCNKDSFSHPYVKISEKFTHFFTKPNIWAFKAELSVSRKDRFSLNKPNNFQLKPTPKLPQHFSSSINKFNNTYFNPLDVCDSFSFSGTFEWRKALWRQNWRPGLKLRWCASSQQRSACQNNVTSTCQREVSEGGRIMLLSNHVWDKILCHCIDSIRALFNTDQVFTLIHQRWVLD